MGHVVAAGKVLHELFGAGVAQAGLFVVDVQAVVVVRGAIEVEKVVPADDRLYEAGVNEIVAVIGFKAAEFVVLRFGADSGLDRVPVDVTDCG